MRGFILALALCFTISPCIARAADGNIVVRDAWLRATLGQNGASAGYLTIENKGTKADRLVGIKTSLDGMAHLHESTMQDGVMLMLPVEGILIMPGQSRELKPGGLHIMIMGLKKPLNPGDPVTFDLEFDRAGHIKVDAKVRGIERTQ